MQDHGYVCGRQANLASDLRSRQLLQHAQGHDLPLHLAELLDTTQYGDMSLGLGNQIVRGGTVIHEAHCVERVVRPSAVVAFANVPRGVAHDHCQKC